MFSYFYTSMHVTHRQTEMPQHIPALA